MRTVLSLTFFVLCVTTALAQAPIPKGRVPMIGLASAVEKDGKVIIEVLELREVMRMQIPQRGGVFIEKVHSLQLKTGALGTDIRAYRLDGKLAERQEVLNFLAKPRAVAYFLGYDRKNPASPDTFYLNMLKE